MKFDNVKIEHITLALQDFKEKGLPVGFKSSAYFDVKIDGELYPPKPIIAYANFYATGEEPTNDFSGGVDTPCFKAFERLGIPIIRKTESMSSNDESKSLKKEFIHWLIANPKVNYYNNDYGKLEQELDRYNDFFSIDIFNASNLKGVKKFLQKELYETATSDFLEFSEKTSRHLPRAVLGNKNYFEFLNTKQSVDQNNNNFTWVPTYKSIVQHIRDKKDHQKILLDLLKNSGCDLFNDQNEQGNLIELDEIDPFTFFCYLNKYFKQRLEILQNLAKSINAPIPKDDYGIPSANPQKVWMFPYKYERNNDEIDRLWSFFFSALENTITNDQFEDILQIRNVALTKITEALFYVAPETYFPINRPTKQYLEEVLGIKPIFKTFTEYQSILNLIKSKSNKPFYQLSYEARQGFENFDSELKDFEKSIEKNNSLDLEIYFQYLEELTNILNLKIGDDRVVFSCKGNYLNFNIGQRITWRLDPKKDKRFYIITDKKVNENTLPFDGGPDHFYHVFNSIDDLEQIRISSLNASITELSRTIKSGYKKHNNKYFEKAVYDKTFRSKYLKIDVMENEENTIDLNQIFFGPPGTGKTFHTINEAIKIVDPEFYKIHKNNREQLKARFKLLSLNNDNESVGQIGFTTFHQSFSYEDFIEGIKPNEPKEGDAFLKYEIQEGVFKKICRLADDSLNAVAVDTKSLISLSTEEYEKAHFYKMSLGNTQDESDNEIYEYCIENNCISIGFGNQLDFTGKDEKELRSFGNDNDLDSFSIQAMNLFSNYLKIGNYVVISYGNKYVRAVGKVTGDYEYRDDSELPNNLHYKHFRSVEWIFTDEKISANEIYNKNLSQQTIYKLDKKYIKQEFFVKEKKIDTHRLPKNPKNFVLIVDEINRGNVSSVFGELITLIEKDKRAGADEELSVTLPYSKETFSVPHNVYIIGTMNTADRSIEALDTALRRRFSFREMPPKPQLIKTVGSLNSTNGKLGDIDVVKILKTINNRIEKLIDKDHKIGHSYFLNISSKQDLINTFRDKVIPLLEEYFFGDFGKISLVLGSSFISKESADGVTFANSNDYDPSIANDLLERSVYEITNENSWDFKAIYE